MSAVYIKIYRYLSGIIINKRWAKTQKQTNNIKQSKTQTSNSSGTQKQHFVEYYTCIPIHIYAANKFGRFCLWACAVHAMAVTSAKQLNSIRAFCSGLCFYVAYDLSVMIVVHNWLMHLLLQQSNEISSQAHIFIRAASKRADDGDFDGSINCRSSMWAAHNLSMCYTLSLTWA